MRKEEVFLFSDIGNIKTKNFFVISDSIADLSSVSRKNICDYSGISYNTVAKAVESLLDIGLICEKLSGKTYEYSLSRKHCFIIFDLSDKGFAFTVCTLKGEKIDRLIYRPNDSYFYDENLSFFMKDMSRHTKNRYKNLTFIGGAVILPDNVEECCGTKNILKDWRRLSHLVRSYFDIHCVLCDTASQMAAYYPSVSPSLTIRNHGNEISCFITGVGEIHPSTLKSERASILKSTGESASSLARSIAYAVGNTCRLLYPKKIYLDGEGVFLLPSFAREFITALGEFTCLPESLLPEIVCTNGTMALLGAATELRHRYIELRLNT